MPIPAMMALQATKRASGVTLLAEDTFTRANSTSTMGTTETGGQTWTPNSGTWGISSNKAYMLVGVSQATTVVDVSDANVTVQVTFTGGTDGGLCVRSSDDSNNIISNGGSVFKRVAGSFTSLGSFTYSAGDTIKITVNGSAIEAFQNGASELSTSDSFNSSATKHGLRCHNDSAARFDDFSVTDP